MGASVVVFPVCRLAWRICTAFFCPVDQDKEVSAFQPVSVILGSDLGEFWTLLGSMTRELLRCMATRPVIGVSGQIESDDGS